MIIMIIMLIMKCKNNNNNDEIKVGICINVWNDINCNPISIHRIF